MTEKKKGKGKWLAAQLLFALIILALIFGTGFALTNLFIEPDLPLNRVTSYPYTVKYAVEILADETIYIGSVSLLAVLADNSSVSITTNGEVSIMSIGDLKEITERRAQITIFGILIFETNYRVEIRYLGPVQHPSNPEQEILAFDASIETSEQIPGFILSHVVPVSVSMHIVTSTGWSGRSHVW